MSGFDVFLGNEKLITRLRRDILRGSLAHAYIIEGDEGCGKRTLARLICAADSCCENEPPCMECINCSKIARGQSPDVITVTPEKDRVQITVDTIRKLCENVSFAPNDLAKKYFIIPNAGAMNEQAQNALLKTLEEPPAHVMFLLLCENSDELLSTIRSRAPILRVQVLSDELISKQLLLTNTDAKALYERDRDAFDAIIKLSRGSLGRAIALTDKKSASECLERYKKAERYLELLSERRGSANELQFHEFSVKLAKGRAEISEIYVLIADAIRDLIACKLCNNAHTVFYRSEETARAVSDKFALGTLIKLTDVFIGARNAIERNMNINLSMMQTSVAAVNATRTSRK
ncbi:MAG: hypothetical protein IKU61_01795 [Clostridia bacterium]|nr:hypothetical protein [Clostridia bacterium]